jgi:hypothetical protein
VVHLCTHITFSIGECVVCVHGTVPNLKTVPCTQRGPDSRGFSIWKNVTTLKPGSNRYPDNHHINFKMSEPDWRFSQIWRTGHWFSPVSSFYFQFEKIMGLHSFCALTLNSQFIFLMKKINKIWETIGKLFATFGPTFSFQILWVHQLLRIPILI